MRCPLPCLSSSHSRLVASAIETSKPGASFCVSDPGRAEGKCRSLPSKKPPKKESHNFLKNNCFGMFWIRDDRRVSTCSACLGMTQQPCPPPLGRYGRPGKKEQTGAGFRAVTECLRPTFAPTRPVGPPRESSAWDL